MANKHLFGTSEKSDFIVNMTDEGAKKFCAMYCIFAMLIIELAAIPYYFTKNVIDYTETIGTLNIPHYLSDKVIYWVGVVMLGLGMLGLSVLMIGKMKKQVGFVNNKALLWLLGVIVMSLISSLAAGSINNAMTGYLDRAEGFMTLIGYYGFFAAAFTVIADNWRKRLCAVIVAIGAVNALVGILQVIPALNDIIPNWFQELNISYTTVYAIPAANGLAMAPHALAALLTVAFAVAFVSMIFAEKRSSQLLFGAAALLMASAAVFTRTFTALLGIGCAAVLGTVVGIVYAVKGKAEDKTEDSSEDDKPASVKSRKSVLLATLCGLVLVCGCVGGTFASQLIAYPEGEGYKTFYDEEVIRTDSIRMLMLLQKDDDGTWVYPYLWDDGLYVAEQEPFLGTGPDNWSTISTYGATIDRSYNEYIDTAMQRGFVTLGLYGVFLLISLFKAFKAVAAFIKGETGWAAPAVACAVLAYMVQAFFNISALTSSPFFFICVGLVWSYGALKKSRATGK
ncbi:MAG: O-antigen ligase family protein [Ruminococcus sp.]|nr:O-antigen ligase family protein [Ruminococcus sp.]